MKKFNELVSSKKENIHVYKLLINDNGRIAYTPEKGGSFLLPKYSTLENLKKDISIENPLEYGVFYEETDTAILHHIYYTISIDSMKNKDFKFAAPYELYVRSKNQANPDVIAIDSLICEEDKAVINKIKQFTESFVISSQKYGDFNDALFNVGHFKVWSESLKERSATIRKMFNENEDSLKQILPFLQDLNYNTAFAFLNAISKFTAEKMHDSCIIMEILTALAKFYENTEEYDKLILVYQHCAYEEMEYDIKLDDISNIYNARDWYLKIINLKDKYEELNTSSRRVIFQSYYNLIGTLSDWIEDNRIQIVPYYKEAISFYEKCCDRDSEIIQEEIYYINYVFSEVYKYFLDQKLPNREEYFSLLKKLKNAGKIEVNVDLINIVKDYYDGKFSSQETILKLYIILNDLKSDIATYEFTDECIASFSNFVDTAHIFFKLLGECKMINRNNYIQPIIEPILNYLSMVPYKEYTSFFDEIRYSLFKDLLPFMNTFEEKEQLLLKLVLERQPLTYIHSFMVQKIASIIAKSILQEKNSIFSSVSSFFATNRDLLQYIEKAALFHDLGKCLIVGVINMQLRKLSDKEFKAIKSHPSKALELLKNDSDFSKYFDVMLGHHKFYDGSGGYPFEFDNTKSKYRIIIDLITICDCMDAATDILGRNYTSGKNFNSLLQELIKDKGVKYNPELVDFINNDEMLKQELDYLTTDGRMLVYYNTFADIFKNKI